MVPAPSVLVLGIGNVLWADEGFGVRCIERLHEQWDLGDDVRVMDGGTQGLYLVPYVTESRHVLVFDAVDFADPPGTVRVIRGADVPSVMGAHNVSLHQVGFQDVLAAASLLGRAPQAITLVGVQPEILEDYGGGLTTTVAARIDEAIAIALAELGAWGITAVRHAARPEPLAAASIQRGVYEAGRPSAEDACRIGDDRFFP
ncbi:MAG TPA: HyaD/HybD family hydrogenase maturation endopeptidase, partial [Labilithrix sp.]|nr:HyaD/HybD family hydrogenase maturation endopeptidase [Labilithrix sp.]